MMFRLFIIYFASVIYGNVDTCQGEGNRLERIPLERTFIAIKPDGVQRALVGRIVSRFEDKGFQLVAMKMTTPGRTQLEIHYDELSARPFFQGLVDYMNSGPIVAMVWEGPNVVKTARLMLGATNPADALPGTIRGDYSVQVGRNVCHGSDSIESAHREISLWFSHDEISSWEPAVSHWINDAN